MRALLLWLALAQSCGSWREQPACSEDHVGEWWKYGVGPSLDADVWCRRDGWRSRRPSYRWIPLRIERPVEAQRRGR